jgi:hypothetical protein
MKISNEATYMLRLQCFERCLGHPLQKPTNVPDVIDPGQRTQTALVIKVGNETREVATDLRRDRRFRDVVSHDRCARGWVVATLGFGSYALHGRDHHVP